MSFTKCICQDKRQRAKRSASLAQDVAKKSFEIPRFEFAAAYFARYCRTNGSKKPPLTLESPEIIFLDTRRESTCVLMISLTYATSASCVVRSSRSAFGNGLRRKQSATRVGRTAASNRTSLAIWLA